MLGLSWCTQWLCKCVNTDDCWSRCLLRLSSSSSIVDLWPRKMISLIFHLFIAGLTKFGIDSSSIGFSFEVHTELLDISRLGVE